MNAAIKYLELKIKIIEDIEKTLRSSFFLQFDPKDDSFFVDLGNDQEERVSLKLLNKDSFKKYRYPLFSVYCGDEYFEDPEQARVFLDSLKTLEDPCQFRIKGKVITINPRSQYAFGEPYSNICDGKNAACKIAEYVCQGAGFKIREVEIKIRDQYTF